MTKDLLILVDEKDNETGTLDKLSVHQQGLLHRAFSVFIFNDKGELLLQQRADEKYHSPGLWSNTCCSHPLSGEEIVDTIQRRLEEEMGMQCPIEFKFTFIYKAQFENGLTEYELDHIYFGKSNDIPKHNPAEVKAWKYISLHNLKEAIAQHPEDYTAWLKIALSRVAERWANSK